MPHVTDKDEDLTFSQFVQIHQPQLNSSGVPERFWLTLHGKLKEEIYDAGNCFQIIKEEQESDEAENEAEECLEHTWKVIVYIEDGISHTDPEHIYLVDHSWTFRAHEARSYLEEVAGLLERMTSLMDIKTEGKEREERIEEVLNEMWRYNQTYSFGNFHLGSDESMPVWYVMDEFGSRIQHSDYPSFRLIPFFYVPSRLAFSLLFPLRDMEHGEEVTRDYIENTNDPEERRAKLLPWIPSDLTDISYTQIEPDASFFEEYKRTETSPSPDTHSPNLPRDRNLKVFMDYGKMFREHLTDPRFELVETPAEADIIWSNVHFKDFRQMSEDNPGKFINQFPMETVITVKDLLAIVSRRAAPANADPKSLEPGPKWLPVTYNLKTELPQFVSYFQHREAAGLDNHFICKPWNLARGLDMHITNNLSYILRTPESGPKVACKYVEDPVLFFREEIGSVKFDIRYIVLLASTVPLKLYVYQIFWLRFANKPFSLDHYDDYEKHFTVMNYVESANLKQIHCDEFIPMFESQHPAYSWNSVEQDIFQMFREVFQAAVSEPPPKGIGHSPQSRSMYAVDLLLSWKNNDKGERYMQPMICEVNFSPDCDRACLYHPFFVNDVFSALFLEDTDGKHVTLL